MNVQTRLSPLDRFEDYVRHLNDKSSNEKRLLIVTLNEDSSNIAAVDVYKNTGWGKICYGCRYVYNTIFVGKTYTSAEAGSLILLNAASTLTKLEAPHTRTLDRVNVLSNVFLEFVRNDISPESKEQIVKSVRQASASCSVSSAVRQLGFKTTFPPSTVDTKTCERFLKEMNKQIALVKWHKEHLSPRLFGEWKIAMKEACEAWVRALNNLPKRDSAWKPLLEEFSNASSLLKEFDVIVPDVQTDVPDTPPAIESREEVQKKVAVSESHEISIVSSPPPPSVEPISEHSLALVDDRTAEPFNISEPTELVEKEADVVASKSLPTIPQPSNSSSREGDELFLVNVNERLREYSREVPAPSKANEAWRNEFGSMFFKWFNSVRTKSSQQLRKSSASELPKLSERWSSVLDTMGKIAGELEKHEIFGPDGSRFPVGQVRDTLKEYQLVSKFQSVIENVQRLSADVPEPLNFKDIEDFLSTIESQIKTFYPLLESRGTVWDKISSEWSKAVNDAFAQWLPALERSAVAQQKNAKSEQQDALVTTWVDILRRASDVVYSINDLQLSSPIDRTPLEKLKASIQQRHTMQKILAQARTLQGPVDVPDPDVCRRFRNALLAQENAAQKFMTSLPSGSSLKAEFLQEWEAVVDAVMRKWLVAIDIDVRSILDQPSQTPDQLVKVANWGPILFEIEMSESQLPSVKELIPTTRDRIDAWRKIHAQRDAPVIIQELQKLQPGTPLREDSVTEFVSQMKKQLATIAMFNKPFQKGLVEEWRNAAGPLFNTWIDAVKNELVQQFREPPEDLLETWDPILKEMASLSETLTGEGIMSSDESGQHLPAETSIQQLRETLRHIHALHPIATEANQLSVPDPITIDAAHEFIEAAQGQYQKLVSAGLDDEVSKEIWANALAKPFNSFLNQIVKQLEKASPEDLKSLSQEWRAILNETSDLSQFLQQNGAVGFDAAPLQKIIKGLQ